MPVPKLNAERGKRDAVHGLMQLLSRHMVECTPSYCSMVPKEAFHDETQASTALFALPLEQKKKDVD